MRSAAETRLAKVLGYVTQGEASRLEALKLDAHLSGSGAYIPDPPVLAESITTEDLLKEARRQIDTLQRELDKERSARYELEEDMAVLRALKSLLDGL